MVLLAQTDMVVYQTDMVMYQTDMVMYQTDMVVYHSWCNFNKVIAFYSVRFILVRAPQTSSQTAGFK